MRAVSSKARYLIVNADDFGLTPGINRGIREAHERGIVTSASLMVRSPAAAAAAEYAQSHATLSVGLHFDAAEWRFRAGEWYPAYQVIDTDDAAQIRAELERQLREFQRLVGRGPTHLDSHQHVHQQEPARAVLEEMAARLAIPLRGCGGPVRYRGDFYGQTGEGQPCPIGVAEATLQRMIEMLEPGWTELGCHPGYCDGLDSVYRQEREVELAVLCAPEIRATLTRASVVLRSFHDFAQAKTARDN